MYHVLTCGMHFMKIDISLPMTLENTFFHTQNTNALLALFHSVSLTEDNVWHMLYTRPKKTRSLWLTICRAFSYRIKHITHDL